MTATTPGTNCIAVPLHAHVDFEATGNCRRCFPATRVAGPIPPVRNLVGNQSYGTRANLIDPTPSRPYSNGRRAFYGLMWSFYTLVLFIAAVSSIGDKPGYGVLFLALCALAGRYAARIWTFRAKRLLFLIIF